MPGGAGFPPSTVKADRNQCHLLFTWNNLLMLEHRHHYNQESQKHVYSSCTDISVNGEVFFELDVVWVCWNALLGPEGVDLELISSDAWSRFHRVRWIRRSDFQCLLNKF